MMTSQLPDDDRYAELMREILLAEPIRGVPTQPTRLLDHVFIGSQSNAESLRLLRQLEITHVLNCAGYKGPRPSEASPYDGLGIDYYEFQAEDTDRYDISRHFPEAFNYLEKVRRQRGTALVHCALGINRSAAVCLAYMMVHSRMPLLEATRIIKTKRRVVLANKHFQKLLVRFARSRGLLDKICPVSPPPTPTARPSFSPTSSQFKSKYFRSENGGDVVRYDRQPSFYGVNSHDYTTLNSNHSNSNNISSNNEWLNGKSNRVAYNDSNSNTNGTICNSDHLNGMYHDLFERFDRLADSLKTPNTLATGRRAQSTMALTGAAPARSLLRLENGCSSSQRLRDANNASSGFYDDRTNRTAGNIPERSKSRLDHSRPIPSRLDQNDGGRSMSRLDDFRRPPSRLDDLMTRPPSRVGVENVAQLQWRPTSRIGYFQT